MSNLSAVDAHTDVLSQYYIDPSMRQDKAYTLLLLLSLNADKDDLIPCSATQVQRWNATYAIRAHVKAWAEICLICQLLMRTNMCFHNIIDQADTRENIHHSIAT